MTVTRHTPGPWKYRHWSNHSDRNPLEGFSISAADRLVPTNTAEGDLYEAEANARLIAAAPTMLDALKDALCSLEISGQSDYVIGRVRAAITAAEGDA